MMIRVHCTFVNHTGGAPLEKTFECQDKLGAPQMPFWPLPLLTGETVLLNLAMILWCRMEESPIAIATEKELPKK